MDLSDFIPPEGVIASLKAKTKKQALQDLAGHAAELTGLDKRNLFDLLVHRERLGSTGLGRGIAVPHLKSPALDRIVCLFARLEDPVNFDSPDGQPVDLIFLLLAPEHASGDHLRALARISRLIREPATLDRLRGASGVAALQTILTTPAPSVHAA